MSTLQTFRFRLAPDEHVPTLRRMAYELVDVPLRDVLVDGIHPWTVTVHGGDCHPSLTEAFLEHLNAPALKLPELEPFGYCHDIAPQNIYHNHRATRFERTLDAIRRNVCFVDDLTYLELLALARGRLRDNWTHGQARTLAERAHPGFNELRRFLKSRCPRIKLSRLADVDRYDLSRVLSVDDFAARDSLLISEALPSLNFRRAALLDRVTDGHGRLRLAPAIPRMTLTTPATAPHYALVTWHGEQDGARWRFRPDIGTSMPKRRVAGDFAHRWREDEGRLCFATGLERLCAIVETGAAVPSFPALNYLQAGRGPAATAGVAQGGIPAWHVGGFPNERATADELREILRTHGVPMTGAKDVLLRKVARAAASRYRERRPDLDAYFAGRRFIRIDAPPRRTELLHLLEDEPLLGNLLLAMYVLQHLRGNAILDAEHRRSEGEAAPPYTEEQLALALMTQRTTLTGAFLRAG